MSTARVSGLWIYPVKSCRGISLKEMQIGPTGPLHDREWMIVDEQNKFLTLRTVSKLAEIKTALQGPFLHLYLGENKILINTAEECEQVETVTVWNDSFLAGIHTKDINEALSDFLSQTVKLARYQKQSFRDLKGAATETVKATMFADSRPLLLTNQNSFDDLNRRLTEQGFEKSVIDRFRSNIILEDMPAYQEDQIKEIQIGDVRLQNPNLCTRCPIITQDIDTGKVVSKETLKVLADYHRSEKNRVTFGTHFTPNTIGTIRVGDTARVLN